MLKRRGMLIFSVKAATLALMVYLILVAGNRALTRDASWKQYQDPRTRLLWDRVSENDRVVLLGDSVFTSSYVDGAADALWRQLESRVRVPVFNGTLDGAKESDLLLAAELVAQRGHGRAVVFDITPTRFLRSNEPEKWGGNFNKEIDKKITHTVFDAAKFGLFGSMVILDKEIVRNTRTRRTYTRAKHMHNFSWRNDNSLALQRLAKLDSVYRAENNIRDFSFLAQVDTILKNTGNNAIFVLTPVNSGLLKWYSSQGQRNYLPIFNVIHAALVQYLKNNKIRYLDLYEGPGEDCFVDAIHTNACGDLFMATKIADYLMTSGVI
jgi:hypothetical protein